MPSRPSGLVFALMMTVLTLGGCFTNRPIRIEELRALDRAAAVRISTPGREPFRALVDPTEIFEETFLYRQLRYGPRSWMVRFGGWPMVYTAGKFLRYQTEGEKRELPRAEVESMTLEQSSWPLTLLSLPVTLPVGILDFLVHSIRFGFQDVDLTDPLSRTPSSRVRG